MPPSDPLPLLRGLPPVVGRRPRVLVLGSMPSVASLAERQYYGHPRNAFWDIQGALFDAGRDLPYRERLAVLRQQGVALWDVIGQCRRAGSLDSAIHDIEPNDIPGLLRRHRSICSVFLNGGTAAREFRRHVERPHAALLDGLRVQQLPSTSPAHAARDFAAKLTAWRAVADAVRESSD